MQNFEELKYYMALSQVPLIGPVTARTLLHHYGTAENVFKAKYRELQLLEGVGETKATSIKNYDAYDLIDKEYDYITKNEIQIISIHSSTYPSKLKGCYDAPIVLYAKGNIDFNKSKIISVVGTRRNTDYGKELTRQLVSYFEQREDIIIVSGLALGIDTHAHKNALENNIRTVAVLAHGLDKLYPHQNKTLASNIIKNGALLTEYITQTLPDKENFPMRNRIVAGLADVVVVVETAVQGGSMITAHLANSYNKDVVAFPGKTHDVFSAGCNQLIKNNIAHLITSPEELCELMGWASKMQTQPIKQRELFIELDTNEKIIYDLLLSKQEIHIDDIQASTNLSPSIVASVLLHLELKGIVGNSPGKLYKLMN